MPEFMGKKITRAQESARREYQRALAKALGAQSKGTSWRSVQGSIFREQAGWFISASPHVHIYEEVTKANVVVKPMTIDPVFWDLVGLPENREFPLSFRLNGAWTCRPPNFVELQIKEDLNPAIVAGRMIIAASKQLEFVLHSYSLEAFLVTCQAAARRSEGYLPSVVSTLVVMRREDEALAICEEARSKGQHGGFSAPEGSFVEMAVSWLRGSLASATRH